MASRRSAAFRLRAAALAVLVVGVPNLGRAAAPLPSLASEEPARAVGATRSIQADAAELVACDARAGGPRADAGLDRGAVVPITLTRARGVEGALYVPSTFSSDDGTYDVYVHFQPARRASSYRAQRRGGASTRSSS